MYLSLAPTVFVYLRSRGVSDPEAITSEVFLAVLPQLARLHGGAAGLRTLCSASPTLAWSTTGAARPPAGDRRLRAGRGHPPVPSAEDDALPSAGQRTLKTILARCPLISAEALHLRIIADLSIEHVAHAIGRSPGAVKQLQRRALITLRAVLAERQVTAMSRWNDHVRRHDRH